MSSSKTRLEMDQHNPDLPFSAPSQWYKYRCLSCDHADWVEEIVVDAFPPEKPKGFPVLYCPECNGDFKRDESILPVSSYSNPDLLSDS